MVPKNARKYKDRLAKTDRSKSKFDVLRRDTSRGGNFAGMHPAEKRA